MPDSEGPAKPQMVEFGNDSFPRSQREAEKFWENVSFTADLPSRPKHRSQRHGNHQSSRAASRSLTPKTTPDISLRSSGTPVVKLPPPIHSKTQEDPFSTTELLGGRGLNVSSPLSSDEITSLQTRNTICPNSAAIPVPALAATSKDARPFRERELFEVTSPRIPWKCSQPSQ